jgi:hypothetical protein
MMHIEACATSCQDAMPAHLFRLHVDHEDISFIVGLTNEQHEFALAHLISPSRDALSTSGNTSASAPVFRTFRCVIFANFNCSVDWDYAEALDIVNEVHTELHQSVMDLINGGHQASQMISALDGAISGKLACPWKLDC